jgi:autotransporter-associated beta strand protein
MKNMKSCHIRNYFLMSSLLLTWGAMSVQAANVTKLDTMTMNGGATDWSSAPATTDVGEFANTPSSATLAAMTLGGNLTLGGLQLDNNLAGPLTIASGNTLTLGTSGINMSAANNDATINCALTLTATPQTWTVISGRTLTIGVTPSIPSAYVLTITGAGSTTVNGNLNPANADNCGILIKGGNFTASNVTIQRSHNYGSTAPTAASPIAADTGDGFVVTGGSTVASLTTLNIGNNNSAASALVQSGGSLTVSGKVLVGSITTASRWNVFQVSGGSFTASDTVNGIVLSPNNGSSVSSLTEFYLSGGTTTAGKIAFGASTDTVGGNGFMLVKGGSLYVGSGGIVRATPVSGYSSTVSLYSGILGATADWSSSLPIALSGTTFTIQAADASSAAHNISLNGVISGAGALTKTGGGALNLNNANTYTGSTTISAGSLVLGNAGALPKGTALTIGGSGTAGVVDLAGFNAQVSGLATAGTAAGQTITNSSAANISTLTFSNSAASSTFGGVIAGGGKPVALTLLGGNLTLSAQNTYAGNIFISNGKLALSGSGSTFTGAQIVLSNSAAILDLTGMNTLTLASGQSLSGYGAVTGSVVTANCPITPGSNGSGGTLTVSGNLTLNGNVTNQFDLLLDPNAAGSDQIIAGGILNLSGVNTIKINPLAGSLLQGTYHLIQCASVGSGDTNNFQLAGSPGAGLQAAISVTAAGVDLIVTRSGGADRLWVGDGSANLWDLTSTNWLDNGFLDTFTNGNFVTFDDSSTNQIVNLTGALSPAAVTVDATTNYIFQGAGKISGTVSFTKTNSGTLTVLTTNDYNGVTTIAQGTLQVGNGIVSGALGSGSLLNSGQLLMQQPDGATLSNAIAGSGSLVQAGTATLTLNGSNTFSGGVTISSGILQIGGGGTIGAGNVTNNAALIFNNSASNSVGNAISGTGSLTLLDGGIVVLNGNDSYSGTTTVTSGMLLVNNAIGAGAVTVAGGSKLGGNGIIGGAVTINSGGILMPGNPVGTLTIASNLTMNAGSIMNFDLGTSSDRVVVSNDLSLTCTLNVTNSGGLGSGTFTLFTYGGNLLASSIALGSMPSGKLYAIDTTTPGQVNLVVGTIATNIPAFPGAIGFGAAATGGRGGTVYHVTTLADSGTGSFRDAVSKSGRIVIFDVGGYISLASAVSVHGNTTIAGQTAPGGGIGFKGGEISFANSVNIICRHIRIRPGSDTASTGDDCLSLYQASNCIMDHVSLEFGPWNNIDAVGCAAITVQNSIDANPTYQQFGAHTESVGQNYSWFYNIFANSHNRNPLSKINDVFVNNVLYNCDAGYTTHTGTRFKHDIVNNYFIAGPASGGNFPWYQIDNNQSMYFTGNLYDSDRNGALGGSTTVPLPGYQGGGTILTAPWSTWTTNVPVFSQVSAYRMAISQTGALPRDEMDTLLLGQIKTLGNGPTGTGAGTAGPNGGLYTSQTQTGLGNNGYGTIVGGAPPIDSDGDGLPDFWEAAVGLDSNNPNDSTNLTLSGYSQLELYLNWLAGPHVVANNTNVVNVDLSQYASGFTNVNPVYTVSAALNGSVSLLLDGHTARFVTANNYVGQSSFVFTVAGSDGSHMTNTVGLVISSVPPPQDLTWRGDGVANIWDVGTNADWLNGTSVATFNAGDTVTFDDSGSNAPAINLTGTLKPSSVTVAANRNYTFSGSGVLSGAMSLIKSGSGTLTLDTANNYGGGTVVLGGTVVIGSGADVGSGAVTLDGGTLTSTCGPTTAYSLGGVVNVPSTGTLNLSPRMNLNGISGGGVLNLSVSGATFSYDCLNGAAYGGFTGTLNVTGTVPGALLTANFNGGAFDGNLAGTLLNLDNVMLQGRHNSSGNTLTIGALGGTATSSLGGSGYAGNETIVIGGLNLDTTFAGGIFNGVAVTTVNKSGTGTLTLSGTSSFTGGLNINAGTVLVNGSISAGTVNVPAAGTLGGSGSIGGPVTLQSGASLKPAGTLTTVGNLTLNGAKLYFDLANITTPGGGGNDLVSISGGTLTLSGTSTIYPNYLNGALANGTYTLISGGSATTGSAANLAWSGPTGARQTVSLNTSTPGTVLLNVSGSLPAALVWRGTNGNNWDLTTTNWLNGGAADKFFNVDSVTFDDTSTNGNVTVVGTVQPGTIVVTNAAMNYLLSGGSIAGGGSLLKSGSGMLTISNGNSFSGGAIINAGIIQLASDLANSNGLGAGAITLQGGTLNMYDNSTTYNSATWNVVVPPGFTGTWNADSRCDLYGSLTGAGTLNFNVPYVRTSLYGDWSAFDGRINVTGGGEFRVLNFSGYPNAAISLSNNVTADFQGTVNPDGTTLAIGELSGVSSSQLLGGTATNGEVLTWSIGGNNTDATFAGQILEQNTNANTAIQKIGSGTWTLTGGNSYNGGTLVSGGTLVVNNASGSGTGLGDVTVAGGATLGGNGTISGSAALLDGATLAPGNGTGTLTIGNELDLSDLTGLQFGLGTASDKVVVSGNLVLGGLLNVTNTGGFGVGTYTLFTYGGTLTMGNISVASAPAGFVCAISTNTPGQINLVVSTPPPPQFGNISMLGGNFVLTGAGGSSNETYVVLTSTNLGLPLSNWTRLLTNQFDGSGNFNITNVFDTNAPQAFYLLQLP